MNVLPATWPALADLDLDITGREFHRLLGQLPNRIIRYDSEVHEVPWHHPSIRVLNTLNLNTENRN